MTELITKYTGPIKDIRTFYILLTVGFISSLVTGFYSLFLIDILIQGGDTSSYISLLASLDAITWIVLGLGMTFILTQFSARTIMVGSMVLSAVLIAIIFFLVKDVDLFPIAYILFLLTGALARTYAVTFIDCMANPKYIARVESFVTVFIGAGFVIGPLFVTFGLTHISSATIVSIALSLVSALLFVGHHKIIPLSDLDQDNDREQKQAKKKKRSSIYLTFAIPTAAVAGFLFGMGGQISYFLLPLYVKSIHWTVEDGSLVISATSLGSMVMLPILAHFIDRYNKRVIFGLLGLAIFICFSITLLMQNYFIFMGAFFVAGGLFAVMNPLSHSMYGEQYKGSDLAKAITTQSLTYGLGCICGPYFVLLIRPMIGPQAFLISLAIIGAATFFIGFFSYRHSRRRRKA